MPNQTVFLFILLVYFGSSAFAALLRMAGPNWHGRAPTFVGSVIKAVWSVFIFCWICDILFF